MLTFIVNPAAGNQHALKVQAMLEQELSRRGISEYRVFRTERPGHATELACAAVRHTDCTGVIAVGGDGTAFEVACGLMNTGIPMGIIPAGTGNDFIKTIGIPKKPLEALNFILTHPPRPVDVGSLNDRLFLNICGTGFDVTVLDYTLAAKKFCRGIFPYLIGLVRGILHYKPVHVAFTADGHTEERDVLICSVANGQIFGGGIPLCPIASAEDGLLDLIVVEHQPRWKLPFLVPALLTGRLLELPITSHKQCREVSIVSKGMRLNVDGEIFNMDTAAFRINQAALNMYW